MDQRFSIIYYQAQMEIVVLHTHGEQDAERKKKQNDSFASRKRQFCVLD